MKRIIVYYLLLLAFIGLWVVFLIHQSSVNMSMTTIISYSVLLAVYVVLLSLVGEGKAQDEREHYHRYLANRAAVVIGTVVLSIGILYQLFTHQLDLWLLWALVAINITKIASYIYSHYRK